ncbi:CRISPR-associated helicase/endonuclease Cas3 [Cronobacter dublinensis]|uniref:CRISPR-associated helicase/endonuclease Cas3 n=1 Tax=Cronobacter dublinensis TaxID=413497 RepID=UPI00029BFF48|nr:CRISPR-associated helicase/endonuclease Cas3 [Cronobacter dublinensis]MDI6441134.1 CRISPR-associated helicase/endonuclease Cas3 [Cronobacter dublinensis]NCH94858.1 CRISPR-associated helicase/endonuclease Cas3 [Cronobacter dublinensis]CCJ87635.1 CRISPR-associated helicase Cas3, protein [Cronobacter dublinensis 582]
MLALPFVYWGKSSFQQGNTLEYHLLPYHCLDVVAVADIWWGSSASLRKAFCSNAKSSESEIKAWVLFFIALHDVGKFDFRFQNKVPELWRKLSPACLDHNLPGWHVFKEYNHGSGGLALFYSDYFNSKAEPVTDRTQFGVNRTHSYQSWAPWMEAVTGHHGFITKISRAVGEHSFPQGCAALIEQDKKARQAWVSCMESLFLKPAGLTSLSPVPTLSPLLAGFCSVCDWLGSMQTEASFLWKSEPVNTLEALQDYYQQKRQHDAVRNLSHAGLLSHKAPYTGITSLLEGYSPRQVQTLIDNIPVEPGLTLIEAPTGAGKTEAALAYAWKMLVNDYADSIIFALPTQATANAMLTRMDKLAGKFFDNPNVVLAHGNARFNHDFEVIKQRGRNAQGADEAWAQGCDWISQSRKRAFLGQIGVCTIDQVLVSVLPVRHRFIRGFGTGRSILIVDEVHAYSSYMYGLLNAVLQQQASSAGSVILLSATLPLFQKQQLLKSWCANPSLPLSFNKQPYPLITWCNQNDIHCFDLADNPAHLPPRLEVKIEKIYLDKLKPDQALLKRMVDAARQGAQVCLVCNRVDEAQQAFASLQNYQSDDIDILIFHARYTLTDRQKIESQILNYFGKEGERQRGRILVATQVIEQSLDVDFDWLITQLCPVDLLFQRLGRLHRHQRDARPQGFTSPLATLLLPEKEDDDQHRKIYGNAQVLWRTQKYFENLNGPLVFPEAYRSWIEPIYAQEPEEYQPEWLRIAMENFEKEEDCKRMIARQMLGWAEENALGDDDNNIRAVTRDGEMSISLVPYVLVPAGKQLLDGRIFERLPEYEQSEAVALNRVNVPASWKKTFNFELNENGEVWLAGEKRHNEWFYSNGKRNLLYSERKGMMSIIP